MNTEELLHVWGNYLATADWKQLIDGVQPVQTGCGPVYELVNPINRPAESCTVADMRELNIVEPHYHPHETEIYFVLQGAGKIVVGGNVQDLQPGDTIVTPPDTAHFTIPENDLVLFVVNTPPFKPENYVALTLSNPGVGFDQAQYEAYKSSTQ